MKDEKWTKIDELFHAAIKIEAEKRSEYIKTESGGDEEIIAEVTKLISAHQEAQNFIENPVAGEALKAISDDDASEKSTKNFRPKTIGPYLLLEKLGRGAFGEVWLAEKQSSLVTAKFALKFHKDDDIELGTIRKEAELWQKASGHPNILPLIEANVYDGQAVIVSEYVKDGSLETWLRNNDGKSPSQEKAVEIMNGILDGLEHLHNRRIFHRDLKPANILMQEGKPRLTDFGVSKILKDEGNTTKNISGTVAYMSPEALEGKRNLQSDLWSAAVIFYQMLTGQMPFQTPDQVSLMLAIVTKEPFELSPDIKDKWGDFFKIALNKKAELRFQTASQMKQAMNLAWENLTLEPVTRKYQNLNLQNAESLSKESVGVKNQTADSNVKRTQALHSNTTDADVPKTNKSKWLFAGIGAGILALILSVGGYFILVRNNSTVQSRQNPADRANERGSFKLKNYLLMTEEEKTQFVSFEAQRILREIKQGEESEITENGIEQIKNFLISYSKRLENKTSDTCRFGNNISFMLDRGQKIAGDIGAEFKKNELSPLIGVYLAMIESEFCPCLQSPTGNLGLFQFTQSQANEYGLRSVKGSSPSNPDGRCDPKLSSKAASVRMKKLIAEDFGDGKNRVSFAVSGFNADNLNLKENIEAAKKKGETSISIWQVIENKANVPNEIEREISKYFPKFLAAAIIGENPMIFGVRMPSLSSFADPEKANSDSAHTAQNQILEKIQTANFKKTIKGDKSESKFTFEAGVGETVLKIKTTAQIDNAGANIYFKDQNGEEIVPFITAQANTIEGATVETVKIKSEKRMLVNIEIKEIQYGSRATYPGTLEIDFSGAFIGQQ